MKKEEFQIELNLKVTKLLKEIEEGEGSLSTIELYEFLINVKKYLTEA
jgi:hypothetical protein